MTPAPASKEHVDLRICRRRRVVAAGDRETRLPDLSFRLLLLLTERAPEHVAYAEIEQVVWGAAVTRDTMKQRVKLLRDSLTSIGAPDRAIESVRNAGYRTELRIGILGPEASRRSPWRLTAGLALVATIVAASIFWGRFPAGSTPVTIAVESGGVTPGIDGTDWSGARAALVRDLSKIEGVRVLDRPALSGSDAQANLRATLALVPTSTGFRLSVQLVDDQSRAVLYAENYEYRPGDYERALRHFVNNAYPGIAALSPELGKAGFGQQDVAVRSSYLRALALWRTGELRSLNAARRLLETMTTTRPGFLPAASLLARVKADLVLRHGADTQLAREAALVADRLVEAYPGIGDFRFTLARAKMALGQRREALNDMRIAQQTMPFVARDVQALERELLSKSDP
ncbi:Transcriptional regulatory protein, C terminal [Sphingopyxis indica]|uniref:Transcriptional regulatory protein, C terminal n=2 Tax=Sphingopyxis indica TaxID=436663 RepID=A0A239D3Y8_9SPHN|nr:Transcriptional regulatory protein, C terminal [Sphingopyxis indica]